MMETKKQYQAPKLTKYAYRTEVGYVGSIMEQMVFWDNEEGTQQVEDYTQHEVWNNGNGFWN